ncbi:flagellar hook-basal body complex protein, partial [bacterium]|nr:flagellar hook-basal body complex protein [bacterium]
MLRALYTGVTGVKAHQVWIDNIANNVANVNTDGFKKTSTGFDDLISQRMGFALPAEVTKGGVNPEQVGIGVRVNSEVIHTSGSIKPTEKETDLAINGGGYFVVGNEENKFYTRNGNF